MSIFKCTSCQRTCAGAKPSFCAWCESTKIELVGPSSAPFNPFAYFQALKAHPEEYVQLSELVAEALAYRAIRNAPTMESLKEEWLRAGAAAKGAKDDALYRNLEAAKDLRKEQLTA
jgi:hypothetical protein